MINNTLNIYCIIVTYNGAKWIEKCFTSLIESTVPLKIIAVDNASSDNTVALIKEKFPLVMLIETGKNLGFGQANNAGIKRALEQNADYVFLLNQDTWIKNDAVEKLISAAKENPEYGIISPFHLNYEGSAIEKYFNDYVIGYYTPEYTNDMQFGTLQAIYSSAFIHCAAWLISSATVKKIGGFDPLFFHYGEDNDLVQRLQFKNLKAGFVINAKLYHEGTNAGLISPESNYTLNLNSALLKLKNPNASFFGALFLFARNFTKSIFKSITQHNRIAFKMEIKIFCFVINNFFKIIRSRKTQLVEYAFITKKRSAKRSL